MSILQENKCPSCGGGLNFDSNLQKLKCPYCDSEFDVEAMRARDEVLNQTLETPSAMDWEIHGGSQWSEAEKDNLCLYNCKSCGAEIVGDINMAATECAYCGNTLVVMNQFSGMLKPDYVIPFQLDKKAAKASLKKHLQGKKLLPKAFTDENHIDEIKGIYVPFWLFDADVDADMLFKVTRVNSYSDSQYNYTKTSHYAVKRSGQMSFNNVPVDGSSKMADDLMEAIEPFDLNGLKPFETAYLAGYMADKYDVDEEKSITRANNRIKKSTEEMFRASITDAATVAVEGSSIRLSNSKAKYALYPVWILNTTYRGDKYVFAMNGQTGKFVGDLPMDKNRYWMYVGLRAGIVAPIAFLISWFMF